MFYLILSLLAIISIFLLKLWLDKRLKGAKSNYELTKVRYDTLLKEAQGFRKKNASLSGNVQSLIEFYELTRELTKYLTFDEVFVVFRERLRRDIVLEDCQFIKPGVDFSPPSEYEPFPLKIDELFLGHLAIKGLRREDKDKFYILFDQFLLVLKRVHLYEKIEELSITDSLTGLFLRRYLQERLEGEIARSNRFNLEFVFLMLDLDHFKSYNDRYGHLVGDVVLRTVARIIKENLRQIDIVARFGGEEFSVILPDTDKHEAEYVSLRLCRAIEKAHIRAYDEKLQITVSIGGSIFPQDARDAQNLIDRADQALYRAKEAGRNRVCF